MLAFATIGRNRYGYELQRMNRQLFVTGAVLSSFCVIFGDSTACAQQLSAAQKGTVKRIEALRGNIRFRKNGDVSVFLEDTAATNSDIAMLKVFRKLTFLNIGSTRVTDVGLSQLKGMTRLVSLVVADTNITDTGLAHLKGIQSLKTLSLARTKITDKGWQVSMN